MTWQETEYWTLCLMHSHLSKVHRCNYVLQSAKQEPSYLYADGFSPDQGCSVEVSVLVRRSGLVGDSEEHTSRELLNTN